MPPMHSGIGPNYQETLMASIAPAKTRISLDTWAVVLSLALALLVRIGLLKSIAW